MKKILLVLLILFIAGGSAFAFDVMSFPPPVKAGNIMLDVGVGLMSVAYTGAKWTIPPLFAQVEYALPVELPISVGAMFTISRYEYKWTGIYGSTWSWMDMTIAGRANWHWGFDINWLDFYTGLSAGYTISNFESSVQSHVGLDNSGVFFSGQLGAHFYFKNNIGAMVEFGYPYWLKAGVALKL